MKKRSLFLAMTVTMVMFAGLAGCGEEKKAASFLDETETAKVIEATTEAPTIVIKSSETTTEATTEVVTEAPAEPETEAPTEPVTESETEAPTEAPTEAVIEASTEVIVEAPVQEYITEAPAPVQSSGGLRILNSKQTDKGTKYHYDGTSIDINKVDIPAGVTYERQADGNYSFYYKGERITGTRNDWSYTEEEVYEHLNKILKSQVRWVDNGHKYVEE